MDLQNIFLEIINEFKQGCKIKVNYKIQLYSDIQGIFNWNLKFKNTVYNKSPKKYIGINLTNFSRICIWNL